jgi:hypothetical protein
MAREPLKKMFQGRLVSATQQWLGYLKIRSESSGQ